MSAFARVDSSPSLPPVIAIVHARICLCFEVGPGFSLGNKTGHKLGL